jgi:hypothetical protein
MMLRIAGRKGVEVDAALDRLVASGRIQRETTDTGPRYRSTGFVIPLGAEAGWEAAVLDHYHALVRAICQKIAIASSSSPQDFVGGSTYTFAVWAGHPLRDEVMSSLKRFREIFGELRGRVDAHNDANGIPDEYEQVVVYGGQSVTTQEKTSKRSP